MSEWDRSDVPDGDGDEETVVDKLEDVVALLVLGAGLIALFLGYSWFWIVFAVGFAVLVPLVDVIGDLLFETDESADSVVGGTNREADSLEALKRRYARGEIDEAEFERRLEVLVDADSPDDVAERLERLRDGSASDRATSQNSSARAREGVEDRELER